MAPEEIPMYAVIMAGGKGTRFWPLSREKRPKHLLNMTGEKSIIQYTVDRISPLVAQDRILIVTGASHADQIREQLPQIPSENILVEPVGRNTAPCIGLAAMHIRKKEPDAVMCVLPADHLIQDTEPFLASLIAARDMAEKRACLVTIGVRPRWAETGYGYMERGQTADTIGDTKIYQVKSFREKPDRATAESFLKSGKFFWNSGIFVWKVSTLLDTIENLLPDLHEGLCAIGESIRTDREMRALSEVYRRIEPVSIDYGVMEKASDVVMLEGDFGWNDIGSWDALWDVLGKDAKGNVARGRVLRSGTSNCLVHSPDKMVALVGVKDLLVVETDDALLVSERSIARRQEGGGAPRKKRDEGIPVSMADIIGFTAAVISSLAMSPQVIKIYRTKQTHDLSLGAFAVLGTGLLLWLVYGLLIHSAPVMLGNAVGFSLTLYIIVMKIMHG